MGLLDFDLDKLSIWEETTIIRSNPLVIALPTISQDGDEGGMLQEPMIPCNCCDWAMTYDYRNQLAFFRHLRREARVRDPPLGRFVQPPIMHAIVLKVIEIERKLSYAGFLTLKLPRQSTTGEAANRNQDGQDEEVDGE